MLILLQRVTSVSRRAQANAHVVSYWLRRCPIDDGGWRDWTVHRARGAGGGACSSPLHCHATDRLAAAAS